MNQTASWRDEYQFPANYLTVDGHRIHYVDHQGGDGAEPVLMVHGNPTWSFYYRRLLKSVGDSGRAIAVDMFPITDADRGSGGIDFQLKIQILTPQG